MKYEWIDEYILKMPGVTKDLQKEWNWIRYQIGGKMFAAVCGKVFHAPEGKECPIYYCCRIRNGFNSCGECDKLPCDLILGTRDPSMSEGEFMKNVNERVKRLRG